MKYLFFIIILLIFSACANLTSADRKNVDEDELLQLETQNAVFRAVPDNFRKIDFTNYSFPYKFSDSQKENTFQLEDEKYTYEFAVNDRGFISFNDIFYIDLTGDDIKEAVVLLQRYSCATGCDGGSELFYIYSMQHNKPEIIWQYETGSLGYGEGLKSFAIENKKIIVETFGLCETEQFKPDSTIDLSCGKYRAKDIFRKSYAFKDSKFVMEIEQKIKTPIVNVMNYKAKISINN